MWGNAKDMTSKEMPIGDFLNMVDIGNRWTYEGSLTTPPCTNSIMWNVVKKVYPISKAQLELFQKELKRNTNQKLVETGTYRNV